MVSKYDFDIKILVYHWIYSQGWDILIVSQAQYGQGSASNGCKQPDNFILVVFLNFTQLSLVTARSLTIKAEA